MWGAGGGGGAEEAEEEAVRQLRWARIENHLEDMVGGIEAKEKLAAALAAKGRELAELSNRYAAQFAVERAAKRALEAEVEALQVRVAAAAAVAAAGSAGGASGKVSEGDARLRAQLEQAQARLRETDARLRDILAAQRLKERSEVELTRLRTEIASLWRAKEAQLLILRRERADAAREAAAHKTRTAELAQNARRTETAVCVLKSELRARTAEAEAAQSKVAALMLKLGGAGGGVKARCAAVRAVAVSMAGVRKRGGGAGGARSNAPPATSDSILAANSSLLTLSALHPAAAQPSAAAAAAAAAAASMPAAASGGAADVEALRHQLESAAQAIMERERHVEELERRLAARGDDLRSLQGLMERRVALLARQKRQGGASGSGVGLPKAARLSKGGAEAKAEEGAKGLDSALVAEIEAFFASEAVAGSSVPPSAPAAAQPSSAGQGSQAGEEEAQGSGAPSGTLRDVEDAIEAVRARIAVTDGRILEIAAGDEEIAAAATQGCSAAAPPAQQQHHPLLVLPPNTSPLPALQLLFDMLVAQKTAGRTQSIELSSAHRRIAELEEALEAREAAITASRLHTDKAVCEARWEAMAQGKLIARLSGAAAAAAAAAAGGGGAASGPGPGDQLQAIPQPSELLQLLQQSTEELQQAQHEAGSRARALEAANAEISRLRDALSAAAAAAAAGAAAPTAGSRIASRAASTASSVSSAASVAPTGGSSTARQPAASSAPSGRAPAARASLPVPAQSLSATLNTIATALATSSTFSSAPAATASVRLVGGGRKGAVQPAQHLRSESGVPILSVGMQDLNAPLGRGSGGGRLSSASASTSLGPSSAAAAPPPAPLPAQQQQQQQSCENSTPTAAAGGEAASLGWWKQRGVSVVGVKLAPPPPAPLVQQLRSQLGAALPLAHGSANGAPTGSAPGTSSTVSSPGSEVMRAHTNLEELASPKRA